MLLHDAPDSIKKLAGEVYHAHCTLNPRITLLSTVIIGIDRACRGGQTPSGWGGTSAIVETLRVNALEECRWVLDQFHPEGMVRHLAQQFIQLDELIRERKQLPAVWGGASLTH